MAMSGFKNFVMRGNLVQLAVAVPAVVPHRSRASFFPVRLRAFFQPVSPSSSGVSGPPDTSLCGGIVSRPAGRPGAAG